VHPKQSVYPQPTEAEQEVQFSLENWGNSDGGSGYLGSFSLFVEGDD